MAKASPGPPPVPAAPTQAKHSRMLEEGESQQATVVHSRPAEAGRDKTRPGQPEARADRGAAAPERKTKTAKLRETGWVVCGYVSYKKKRRARQKAKQKPEKHTRSRARSANAERSSKLRSPGQRYANQSSKRANVTRNSQPDRKTSNPSIKTHNPSGKTY